MATLLPLLSLFTSLLGALLFLPTAAVPVATGFKHVGRASNTTTERLVFAHFMIGIVSNRQSSSDYDADMQRAKSLGIDAFALNIGTDSFTDEQLGYAYESAANNSMNVFISFDFNWWSTSDASSIGTKIAEYASLPAQLMVDGKVVVSSFAGDGLDVATMEQAAETSVFFAPNFHPTDDDFGAIDGALNWMAWPNNGDNKAPTAGANISVADGDNAYIAALDGKPYFAPASAWFSTHYGPEVSYSKNWVFPSDLLWFNRWNDILTLGPQMVEIVTWNDYGESHYVAPLSSPHYDDGASKWVMDMPHDGWLDMAAPFIAAYKAGATSPNSFITSDQLFYWYRPNMKSLNCSATDTTMEPANNASGNYFEGQPNGWQTMSDLVFIVSLLTEAATIQATSGNVSQTFSATAGANAFALPMGIGQQSFSVVRNGQTILSGTSLKDIVNTCICGIYNFNAYVGQLPAPTTIDELQPDGLISLSAGLKVACPTNTLALSTTTGVATASATPTALVQRKSSQIPIDTLIHT